MFNFPPKKAVTVAGMQWTSGLITGMEGLVKVAFMSWWTTKGDYATQLRVQEEAMLRKCVRQWGNLLLHVFDRGSGTGPWLRILETLRVRFVIRWKGGLNFIDATGAVKKLWQIGQGKKYFAHGEIRNTHTGLKMPCDVWWAAVRHVDSTEQLYLVKVRVQKHVWYLITNEPVKTAEHAWEMVFAYRRRWQIETSFRYGKSELAMESPRAWHVETRLKLLGIVTLVYAFLPHFLHSTYKKLVDAVLRRKCHHTGKWCQEVIAPLYRVRWAISRLWDDFHPLLGSILPPNVQTLQALASFRG